METVPFEIVFEICQYLLVDDTKEYCIFADESTPFRLTSKTYYNYLYPKLPDAPLLYGPCTSVAEMCPPLSPSERISGLRSSSPYLTVREWTSTAKKRCAYHCHCKMKYQFERYEVWMMKDLAFSLIYQIKRRDSEVGNFAVLKVPSFGFLEKFHQFLQQCGVITDREMSMVLSRSAGAAESTVRYTRNMDFLFRDTNIMVSI